MTSELNEYKVNKIGNNLLKINGKGNHTIWEKAKMLDHFDSPWDNEPIKKISFKALRDETHLYCLFLVEDSEVHIDTTDNSKRSIDNSDRVELFFRTDSNLNPYYCLEIDPTPRLMDFKAKPNKEFDFNWHWPKDDISMKSNIEATYFTVELAISLSSLTQLNLLKNNKIETGIYRAKYHKQENGTYVPTWITWVNPNTEIPNFHIASSFGLLTLEAF